MARRNLRSVANRFRPRANGVDMHLYSAVQEVERELIQRDMELRDEAAQVVVNKTKEILANPSDSVPKEKRRSFTRGLKKRTRRFYSEVGIGKPGFHAFNVETGHDIIRNGVKVGEAAPHPFFKPAWEESADKIKSILSEQRISDD